MRLPRKIIGFKRKCRLPLVVWLWPPSGALNSGNSRDVATNYPISCQVGAASGDGARTSGALSQLLLPLSLERACGRCYVCPMDDHCQNCGAPLPPTMPRDAKGIQLGLLVGGPWCIACCRLAISFCASQQLRRALPSVALLARVQVRA